MAGREPKAFLGIKGSFELMKYLEANPPILNETHAQILERAIKATGLTQMNADHVRSRMAELGLELIRGSSQQSMPPEVEQRIEKLESEKRYLATTLVSLMQSLSIVPQQALHDMCR